MASSGQSIVDRALAAKHTVAGQSLAKSVCKATTEEIMGPKRKHLDYLLHCTNEPNVSIPQLANLLIERTQNSNWVVVFKALITIHNMMNYGNERFTQFLASNNCTLNLDSFYDRGSGIQGYGMSTFIRRYAKYLNQKAYSYRQMAFDFCRAKRGKDEGLLRTMNTEQLIKALPILQLQFDALIEFDVSAGQMNNGIISSAFMLLFKDLIRLYASYNDGIINLLGQYFDMNKKNCRESFEIYKNFLSRVDKVGNFFKVAENVGVDKGDIPDLAKAPASLLDALEQHLNAIENTKKTSVVTKPVVLASAAGQASSASPPAATAAVTVAPSLSSSTGASGAVGISEADRKRILEEEQRMLDMIKQQNQKTSSAWSASVSTPTQSAPTSATVSSRPPDVQKPAGAIRPGFNPFDQVDSGFDLPPVPASYDLLGLQQPVAFSGASTNGFVSSFPADDGLLLSGVPRSNVSPVAATALAPANRVDLFGQSSFSGLDELGVSSSASMGSNQFAQAGSNGFYGGGTGAMTMSKAPPALGGAPPMMFGSASSTLGSAPPMLGGMSSSGLGSLSSGSAERSVSPDKSDKSQKLITKDLDASLATIAGSLSIRTPEHFKRAEHQWAGPHEKRMTGAGNAATGNSWSQPPPSPSMFPVSRPMSSAMVGAQPTMMMAPVQYPAMIPAYPMSMGQPMMTQMAPMFASSSVSSQSTMNSSLIQQQPPQQQLPPNDPFGLL